jgi:hypothetical protein
MIAGTGTNAAKLAVDINATSSVFDAGLAVGAGGITPKEAKYGQL